MPTEFGFEMGALSAPLRTFLFARATEFAAIAQERKLQLAELGAFIEQRVALDEPVRLLFVCTHNSRRSHMADLWAAAAARAFGVQVSTFSGGTEATAFHPNAVAAMRRAGFQIVRSDAGDNPTYLVDLGDGEVPLRAFSKTIGDAPNPQNDFAAIMVCSDADQACPNVPGALARFGISYRDPKESDGTEREEGAYDERCTQIAREMLYVFQCAAQATVGSD